MTTKKLSALLRMCGDDLDVRIERDGILYEVEHVSEKYFSNQKIVVLSDSVKASE